MGRSAQVTRIIKVAFKQITDAEFLAINIKSKGNTSNGGGQSYIDFQSREISEAAWDDFFSGVGVTRNSPKGWVFEVRSLGTSKPPQTGIELSYRDAPKLTRFGLRSQKLPSMSSKGNRLYAWQPEIGGFPALPPGVATQPQLPTHLVSELRIFLIRDDEGQVWAGWRKGPLPANLPSVLAPMFKLAQGMIDVAGNLELDPGDPHWPFAVDAISEGPEWDDEDELEKPEPNIGYSVQKVRKRDKAAAAAVRKLYAKCQLSGDTFLFLTKSGRPYLEVHHLIPLGKGGADSAHNMIVVSPQIHKMLHYADVSAVDLSFVTDNKLSITINGAPFTITWHPQHAARVIAQSQT
jgi:5-methylcytosine-specific restriction enzyme A